MPNETAADVQVQEVNITKSGDLESELATMLVDLDAPKMIGTKQTLRESIESEWIIFKSHGIRGKYLTMAYKILLSVQPTSTESERCFSRSSYLCDKFQGKMKDSTLSALTFLSFFFKRNI